MMLALPGCLSDLSDLDKVQVGLMAVISILSLTKAQVVSGTCLKLVLLGVIKQPRMQRGR